MTWRRKNLSFHDGAIDIASPHRRNLKEILPCAISGLHLSAKKARDVVARSSPRRAEDGRVVTRLGRLSVFDSSTVDVSVTLGFRDAVLFGKPSFFGIDGLAANGADDGL